MACPPELPVRGGVRRQGGAASLFPSLLHWPVPRGAPGGGQTPPSSPCLGTRRVAATRRRRPISPSPLRRHPRTVRHDRTAEQGPEPPAAARTLSVPTPCRGGWRRPRRPSPARRVTGALEKSRPTPASAGAAPHGAGRDQGLYLRYLLDHTFLLEGHRSVSLVRTHAGTHASLACSIRGRYPRFRTDAPVSGDRSLAERSLKAIRHGVSLWVPGEERTLCPGVGERDSNEVKTDPGAT